MDKLENETWEDYAFRNELFIIVYEDKEKQIIGDVCLANPDKYDSYPSVCFMIWRKIQDIRIKYDIPDQVAECNDKRFSYSAIALMSDKDKERQKKLYELKQFWIKKQENIQFTKYNRRNELIQIISETHKEQLEELLSLGILYSKPPYNTPEYNKCEANRKKEEEETKNKYKKERIEIYQKYMKNKELQTQINELEQKINQLKGQIVK